MNLSEIIQIFVYPYNNVLLLTYRKLRVEKIHVYSFSGLKAYCSIQMSSIPMTFVLGFYVSLIVKRWWDQYNLLPWPDSLAIYIAGKVIIEKSRGGRFLWNRNWDLGWIWAGWHYWKKNSWTDYEQLLRPVVSSFREQTKIKKRKTLKRPPWNVA